MGKSRYEGIAAACDSAIRDPLLIVFLIVCVLTVVMVVRLLKTGRGQTHVGFQLSFLAAFWVNHWFGVAVYLTPGYCGISPELEVPGARVSLYALLGFAAGSIFLPKMFGVRPPSRTAAIPPVPSSLRYGLLVVGALFYVAAHLVSITTIGTVFSGGQQLMVVAVVLNIWEAARQRKSKSVAFWVSFSLLFPAATVVRDGFLGFGVMALAPVFIFATTCIGRRNYFRLSILGLVGLYLGLSLFVNYMRDRRQIRASVWGGDRLFDRIERLNETFRNFEWFSLKPSQLDAIGGRMNQNWLVGAGVIYLENTKQWARGDTLKTAVLAFVPRAIWPGKPQIIGGSDTIMRYTGLQFAAGTSVGMGEVLELYVNYGVWLVFFGFTAIGGLFACMDVWARNGLNTGAFNQFIVCSLIALSLEYIIQVFAYIAVSAIVGVVLTYALQMFIRMKFRRAHPTLPSGRLRPHAV